MPTKKPAPKKAAKPIAKPVKKAVSVKPVSKAPVKKVAPAKPIAKHVVKPVAKAPVPTKKPATKAVVVKTAKTDLKKATVKPLAKVAAPSKAATLVKPVKPEVKKAEKPVKPPKPAPAPKPAKKPARVMRPAPKPAPKVSGIEKATTVIPLKQLPQKKKEEVQKDVKMPKITTKTSVPYKPGYTSLEKRIETAKPNEPIVRYSDNELTEFRELINKKLDTAKKELAYLQGLITRKDDMGGDNDDARYMTMEDGSLSMEREQLSQMASRQITYIDHLEKAIMRIESKTYGICRVTGKLIDKARLRAVPHATLSLEAKLGLVKPSGE
jgi:RNA polymerase-binding transcription factor DksA